MESLCYGRNYDSIDEIKGDYHLATLFTLVMDETREQSSVERRTDVPQNTENPVLRPRFGLPKIFRAAFANLLNALWIDVRPQKIVELPSLAVPFDTRQADLFFDQTVRQRNGNGDRSIAKKKDIAEEDFQPFSRVKMRSGAQLWRGTIIECQDSRVKVKWDENGDDDASHNGDVPASEQPVSSIQLDEIQFRKGPNTNQSEFFLIEQVIEDYLEKIGGNQNAFDPPGTQLTLSFLNLLEKLVQFGYYMDPAKINRIANGLVDMLDGRFDVSTAPKILRNNGQQHFDRYKAYSTRSIDSTLVMASKKLICRILSSIYSYGLDFELGVYW